MADTKASSHITTHPFKPGPRGWWDRCAHKVQDSLNDPIRNCGLSEAAHSETTLKESDRK